MTEDRPKVNLKFLYAFCSDVKPIRSFYSDVIGAQEVGFMDNENMGWVCYQSDGLQFMFQRWDEPFPAETRWAAQPGWTVEPNAPLMSFSLEMSVEDLRESVAKAKAAGVTARTPEPNWRQNSYWGWTIQDPMGNTIELYAHTDEKPAEGETPVWA
ncbi:MAG: VOC family protein [Planctomycetota bacterium]